MQAWQIKPGMQYRHGDGVWYRVAKVRVFGGEVGMMLVWEKTGAFRDCVNHVATTEMGDRVVEGDGGIDRLKDVQMGLYSNTTMVGTDFEVFAVGRDGRVMPAWKIVGKQRNKGRGGDAMEPQVFADGFALEASVCPSDCHESVVARMSDQITRMRYAAAGHGATLTPEVCVDVEDQLKDAGEEAQLGCMPSMNAYDEPPLVVEGACVPFRSAGMHVHYGVGPRWVERWGANALVKSIDAIAGVTMTSVVGGWDDPQRRTLYGKAGEYRLPKWGIEYRVGSVAVMRHPAITHLWLDLCRAGLWNGVYEVPWVVTERMVRRIINEGSVGMSRRVLKKNVGSLRKIVEAMYLPKWGQLAVDRTVEVLVEGGVEQMIPGIGMHGKDLAKTWGEISGDGRKWGYYAMGRWGY